MFRAKDDVPPRSLRMAACLTMALSLMELGCSGMTGLRSVGTDRPSLLGFWDRPQPPSPDPAADYYARYMHSARDRADAMAKPSSESSEPDHDDGGPDRYRKAMKSIAPRYAIPASPGNRPTSTKPVRDESLQVTLGPPEPLPALSEPNSPPL